MVSSSSSITVPETLRSGQQGIVSWFRKFYGTSDIISQIGITSLQETPTVAYPKGLKLVCILVGSIIPYMVVVLDDTVIAPIIPVLVAEFQRSTEIGWYASSYFITLTVLMPIYGKCYTLWKIRQVFVVALVLLAVGSVVSAAATVSIVFIIGRAIAGTGAAGVITGAMRTITLAAPRERRTFLEAFGAIIIGICSVSGPLLGGVIAQNIGWRWSFWINAPIAALSIGIIVALFPVDNSPYAEVPIFQKIKLLDVFGGVVLVTSLTCLICGLQVASELEWLSLRVAALLSLAAFFLAVFLLHESFAGETTLFPRRLLRFRLVWIPCVGLFFLFAGFIHHVFFLSIYFQSIQGCSPQESAIRLLPYILSMSLTAMVTALLVTKIKYYNPFIIIGGIFLSIGAGLITFRFAVNTHLGTLILYESLLGAGVGFCIMANVVPCQTLLEEHHHSLSHGLTFLFSMLGASISIPISNAIFHKSLETQIVAMDLRLDVIFIILQQPSHVRIYVPSELLPQVLEVIMNAVSRTFIFGLVCSVASLITFVFLPWSPLITARSLNNRTQSEQDAWI